MTYGAMKVCATQPRFKHSVVQCLNALSLRHTLTTLLALTDAGALPYLH